MVNKNQFVFVESDQMCKDAWLCIQHVQVNSLSSSATSFFTFTFLYIKWLLILWTFFSLRSIESDHNFYNCVLCLIVKLPMLALLKSFLQLCTVPDCRTSDIEIFQIISTILYCASPDMYFIMLSRSITFTSGLWLVVIAIECPTISDYIAAKMYVYR